DVPRRPDSSTESQRRPGPSGPGRRIRCGTTLVAAQPGRGEVLAAGERGDRVLIPSGAVDHDDLGHAARVPEGCSVRHGAGDVHRAEVSEPEDAAAGRTARCLDDDLRLANFGTVHVTGSMANGAA